MDGRENKISTCGWSDEWYKYENENDVRNALVRAKMVFADVWNDDGRERWQNKKGIQVYDVVVSMGIGNDLSRSIVDAWNWAAVINFLEPDLLIGSPFRGLGGDESIIEGV